MDRLTYSPSEAAQVLGVSRPTIYTLIKRADFPAFKVGTRTLVSVDRLRNGKNSIRRWMSASSSTLCGGGVWQIRRSEKPGEASCNLSTDGWRGSRTGEVWQKDGRPKHPTHF